MTFQSLDERSLFQRDAAEQNKNPTMDFKLPIWAVTLDSETPTVRNLNLVAVGDIPEQLGLKYIGHAMREKKGSTQLQCAK